jgi:hypothetical protein
MRLLVALVFLLTPLRGVAAAVLCVSAEHGSGVPCESGMADMGEDEGVMQQDGGAASAPLCGAVGLCAAATPSLVGTIALLPLERATDAGLATSTPQLGPGIRPAPPIHPPRA